MRTKNEKRKKSTGWMLSKMQLWLGYACLLVGVLPSIALLLSGEWCGAVVFGAVAVFGFIVVKSAINELEALEMQERWDDMKKRVDAHQYPKK
jgi:hypothetical protein